MLSRTVEDVERNLEVEIYTRATSSTLPPIVEALRG